MSFEKVQMHCVCYVKHKRTFLLFCIYLFFCCMCLCDRKIGERNGKKILLISPSKFLLHLYFALCIVAVKILFFVFLYNTNVVEPSVKFFFLLHGSSSGRIHCQGAGLDRDSMRLHMGIKEATSGNKNQVGMTLLRWLRRNHPPCYGPG